MTDKTTNIADPERPRGALRFALLSVALLQLSIAVHKFEHVVEYVDDSCQLCVQLDRLGDAVADYSMPTAIQAIPGIPSWQEPTSTVVRASIFGFHSRAPPQL